MDAALATLLAAQAARVAELEAELVTLIAEGNELYASYVRADLIAARSPARLIHKAAS
jgi:hypothetical protein